MENSIKICFISSESDPFIKTGGLADVSGSLPVELSKLGCEVKVFIPFYNLINHSRFNINKIEGIENVKIEIGEKSVYFNLFTCKIQNDNKYCPY